MLSLCLSHSSRGTASLPQPHHRFQRAEVPLCLFLLGMLRSTAVVDAAPSSHSQGEAKHRGKS